jgi:serine/threonine-protein kinase
MGRVYLGEHVLMRKRVAFKVLHKELTQVPEVVTRFEREAMAAANIEHPNVASATDFGKLPDGSVYLVLEYIQGKCLRYLIDEGPIPIVRALHIARQIASAVAAAHSLGIIHRDLKPENVLLVEKNGDPDFVKVLDFGIAKVPVQEVSERGSIRPAKVITRVGMIFGTPEYMAPEQALGQYVDARADLYAMGIVLFEMLSSVRPFSADSPVGILGQQLQGALPSFAQRAPRIRVPPVLEQLIQRLLAPAPASRVASAQALVAALEDILSMVRPRGPGSLVDVPLTSRMLLDTSTAALLGQIPRTEAQVAALVSSIAAPEPDGNASNASTMPAPTYDDLRTHDKKTAASQDSSASVTGRRGSSRKWALLLGLSGTLLAGLVAVAFIVLRPSHKAAVAPQPSVSLVQKPAEAAVAAPVATSATTEELGTANAGGPRKLRELAARFPNDPRVLVELAKAQYSAGNAGECLEAIEHAYSLDAAVNTDAKLATLLWKTVQKRETTDRTLRLLERGFGTRGVDILYDLATTPAVRKDLRQKAATSLRSAEVQQAASPALRSVLVLQQASTCAEKKTLLPSVERTADARVLPELKALQSMAGCGKRKRTDCYPCLRHSLELENAIAAVKKRQP